MTCYVILTFRVIGGRNNVTSPSEMHHEIVLKEKKLWFVLEMIDLKGTADTFYMHTFLNVNLSVLFNITWKYIVCESNGTAKRSVSIVLPFN